MPRTSDADVRLLTAALQLIWKNSYGATSVDDICRAAGVRKGSFYHFFPSKCELAIAALEADWQKKKLFFEEIFSPAVPPLQRITNYFDHIGKSQMARRGQGRCVLGCPVFSLGMELCPQNPAIGDKVREILDCQVRYFEKAIRDAQTQKALPTANARATAQWLFALYLGTLALARIRNDPRMLADLGHGALSLLGSCGAPAAAGAKRTKR